MKVLWTYLGLTPYAAAFDLMKSLRTDVQSGAPGDYLLFLQHPNVITQGYSEKTGDSGLISSRESITQAGFEIISSDRGGLTTLHNPGQLVGYLIFDLARDKMRVRPFVELIEKAVIETLGTYDITAYTIRNEPGVYVGQAKIGFIGLKVEKNVTTHGFALNVRNDLKPFGHIVSCGQLDRPITSLLELIGGSASIYDVYWRFVTVFERLTGAEMEEIEAEHFNAPAT